MVLFNKFREQWLWLFDSTLVTTRRQIIQWWEVRRFTYNLYVGIVGIITWLAVLIAGGASVKPAVDFEEPIAMIIGPFVYGFMANLFYTGGWLFDVTFYKHKPRSFLLGIGLGFSIILTALPGVWAIYCWIHTLITGEKLN